MRSAKIWTLFLATTLAWLHPVAAQTSDSARSVTVKSRKLLVSTGGEFTVTTNLVKLPFDIVVSTNLTYRVGKGKDRPFEEGQILNADGMLLNPDGTTYPVYDHVTMSRNQIRVMKDGDYSNLSGSMKLGDGSIISDDCYVKRSTGARFRLLDGQYFRLSGAAVASKDTISLRNGRVVVQKDGSSFSVARGATLMMNDGTKVFGEGYVIKRDGSRADLAEGQTLTVEGVVVRR